MVDPGRTAAPTAAPPRRSWRVLAIGLPILLAGFAANHLEHFFRQKRLQAAGEGAPVVRAERNLAGHGQIGIDEATLGGGREKTLLRFAALGEWDFDAQKPSPPPDAVAALSGREASCVGFMYPLEAGTKLRLFCLLRTTQTCCYGPRPQYNQYLFVETKEPVKFERFAPVTAVGRFFVDPQPAQGYIYRMEGASISSAAEDEPEVDGAQAARQAGLPLFDFSALAEMEKGGPSAAVPEALLALDGRPAVTEGFILNRSEGPPPGLLLARNGWDGKAQGKPPTIYSAARVFLRDGRQLPPVWKQNGVFIGRVQVTRDTAARPAEGIVSLRDAVRAAAGGGAQARCAQAGPLLAVRYELLILATFVVAAVWAGRPRRAPRSASEGGT